MTRLSLDVDIDEDCRFRELRLVAEVFSAWEMKEEMHLILLIRQKLTSLVLLHVTIEPYINLKIKEFEFYASNDYWQKNLDLKE